MAIGSCLHIRTRFFNEVKTPLMTTCQSSREFNYPFTSKCSSKISGKQNHVIFSWTMDSKLDSTLQCTSSSANQSAALASVYQQSSTNHNYAWKLLLMASLDNYFVIKQMLFSLRPSPAELLHHQLFSSYDKGKVILSGEQQSMQNSIQSAVINSYENIRHSYPLHKQNKLLID